MKRVIAGGLLTILMVVTVGFPVYRHTCHVFDRSELSFHDEDYCCDPFAEAGQAIIDFKCCSLEHLDTGFDYETLVKESGKSLVLYIANDLKPSHGEVFTLSSKSALKPVLRPPPLDNRTLLNKIQVYLI